jgi:hypothetical protein
MGEKVEDFLDRDETFGNLINRVELASSDYQTDAAAQSPTGLLALTFNLEFFTYAQRPDAVCYDTFKTSDTGWKIGHNEEAPDAVIDAEDETTLPQ